MLARSTVPARRVAPDKTSKVCDAVRVYLVEDPDFLGLLERSPYASAGGRLLRQLLVAGVVIQTGPIPR